jgi:Ca2+-binding RTX toxin-like protein
VTFAPGETAKTVRIILSPDSTVEGDQLFYFDIYNSSANVTRPDPIAEVWIIDNDAPAGTPSASVTSMVVDEAQGTATFVVRLDRPATGTVTMNYATQDGSALAGADYTTASGSLIFAAGEVVRTVTVTLANDGANEGNETFRLGLSNLSGATSLVPFGTATIWASDAPAVSQSNAFVDDVAVGEDKLYVDVIIRLEQPNAATATVYYDTRSATASTSDYIGQSEFVTFAPGETAKTVRIILSPDSTVEGDQLFYFDIYNSSANVTRPDPTAEVWIIDNDAPSGTSGNDTLNGTAFADTISGFDGNDNISGNDGDDTLNGGAGDDVIHGGLGNDVIDGAPGIDQMHGDLGNDTFHADNQADLAFEDVGAGTDTFVAASSFYLYANIENLTLTGSANNFGVGNELANTLTGNSGANLLIGGPGNDAVSGGDGNDQLFGEDGNDTLNGDAGIDYIASGAGNDQIFGGADADELHGEDGDDYLDGGTSFHTDILVGWGGNDTLNGISGQANPDYDLMDGGAGDDVYWVDTGADLTFEGVGGGTDTVHANVTVPNAGVYLYANIENLVLEGTTAFGVGNELANQLTGTASGNWLLGGAGSDRIAGMGGSDVLFGEAGADTFVFGAGSGQDVIGDFSIAQDVIEFAAYFTSFAQAQADFVQVGNDGAINLGGGDLIVLHGVTMANLTAANFTFVPAAEPPAAYKLEPVTDGATTVLDRSDAFAFAGNGFGGWHPELHQQVMIA